MIRETTPDAQGNYAGKKRPIYRSDNELKMREAVEAWGRPRWPNARVVHELVMGRGAVRADVAFITPNHIAVVEIKSDRDDTDRLLHQAGMFRAAVPELWIASLHSAACCSDSSSARFTSCRIASVREFPDDATVEGNHCLRRRHPNRRANQREGHKWTAADSPHFSASSSSGSA